MTIAQLLADLADVGVTLRRCGEQLEVEGPTGSLGPDLLERLRQSKQALLQMIQDENALLTKMPLPVPGEGTEACELSLGQQRLVVATQLGEPTIYNEQAAIEFAADVDVLAITEAFAALAHKHDILHTVFTDDEPSQQTVIADARVPLQSWEVRSNDELHTLARSIAQIPFVNGKLLWRVDLFYKATGSVVLVLTIHHAIFDRWTMMLLIRDFSQFLQHPSHVNVAQAASLTYRDFSVWQRRWMDTPEYAAQLDWWKDLLSGIDSFPVIQGDRPPPAVPSGRGATERMKIPADCIRAASEFSRQQNTTLFSTLLSIFQLLHHRYTGESQVLTLAPVASRPFQEAEEIAGFFVNLVAIVGRVYKDDTFHSLVERTRGITTQAFSHQFVPFDAVVEHLRQTRGPRSDQLAHVVFALQNVNLPTVRVEGVDAKPFDLDSPFARFDLYLSIEGDERGMFAVWQYSQDLFDASTIRKMGEHYVSLLRGVLAAPEAPLQSLPMYSDVEYAQLQAWSRHEQPYRADATVVALFREQAAAHPEQTALEQGTECWTYAQLERWSDRAAAVLRSAGAGRGSIIGVTGERSPRLIAAFLACLKAGGAYLPLERNYPDARLSEMVADAEPALILVADDLEPGWLSSYPGPVLKLSACEAELPFPSTLESGAGDLAYVMYTSGSTGKPKGVCIEHRGIVRLATGAGFMQLDTSTVMLQASSLGFDTSTFEIWGCLLNGGRLVLVEQGPLILEAMADTIVSKGVTCAWLTADLFRLMVEEQVASLRGLRELLAGGDALPVASCKAFLEACPDVALINGYGPTENTTFTSTHRVTQEDVHRVSIPIGRPLGNTQVWVVNENGCPVPPGVPGELWTSGDGLARGYLGREDLTVERFVQGPLLGGGRWYRTGDRVRWRHDGVLEFLGRIDTQVKLRGYRIELGEIEMVLGAHPSVSGCAMALKENAAGDKQLVGYVVARSGAAVSTAQVQAWLGERLPGYMVPSIWVWLQTLPQSPSGKVDRKHLPLPAFEIGSVKASTAAEAALVNIWQSLLGLAQVGVQDNFFALGGDSILAIQMASRAAEQDVRITAQDVFRYPTIAQLAVNGGFGAAQGVLAEQGLVDGEVALSPIQKWYVDWPGADWEQFSQGVYFDLHAQVDPQLLSASLAAVARHHDVLGIGWRHDGSTWHQESGAGAAVEVLVEDLRGQADALACLEQSAGALQQSLSLNAASVWAARIYRLDEGWRLVWLVHHVSVDGVSWRILLEDLLRAYGALQRGEAVSLPAKTVSYQAWTQHLATWGNQLPASQLAYWQRMEGSGTDVPMDGDASVSEVGSEARVSLQLDRLMTQQLLREAGERYRVRPEELLVAALARTLCAWSASQECVVDIEGHGRDGVEGVDVGRTVGWFTSLYPLRLTLEGGLANDLKAVKERMRGVPHGGQSYGALRYGREDSGLGRHERSVSFNYLGQWRLDELGTPLAGWRGQAPGGSRRPTMRRRHALEVLAYVQESQLHVDFQYSDLLHRAETMATLAHSFQVELQALLTHCLSVERGGLTPSDLPLAHLDQNEIDEIEHDHPQLADMYGVTPLQQGILFHSVAQNPSFLYVEQLHWRIVGEFRADCFQQAWSEVIRAHAALRTTFRWRDLKTPVQLVHHLLEPDWGTLDWRELSAETCRTRFENLLNTDRERGFDLEHGPLLRGTLIREQESSWRFLWTYHHVVFDGWSVALILKQVLNRYAGLNAGAEILPSSLRPFVSWLSGRDQEDMSVYWQEVLGGIVEPTLTGFESPAHNRQALARDRCAFRVDDALCDALGLAARQAGITQASVLTGAWALTLGLAGGGSDVLFGTTLSGRPADLQQVELTVGLFINTVPVRVRIDDDDVVSDWLQRLHRQQSEREKYSTASLTTVQRWAGLNGGDLLSSLFVVENYPIDSMLKQSDIGVDITELTSIGHTNFPLTAQWVPGEETVLHVIFDTSRYDEVSIRRLGDSFLRVLRQLVLQPQSRIGEISLVSEAQTQQLIYDWNDTPATSDGFLLHEGIKRYAALTPKAAAVIGVSDRMSYDELAAQQERIATSVVAANARSEPVAVFLPRSLHAVAAYAGVMLAGCAYVPVDPATPPRRLQEIFSTIGFVVTTRALAPQFDAIAVQTILVDEVVSAQLPDVAINNLAYVMFTSGSTGKPKGVMIDHRAASLTIESIIERYAIGTRDRLLCVSSAGFDLSVFDFFGAFAVGAAVVLAPESTTVDPGTWLDLMEREQVTVWESVPAVMELLLAECRQSGRKLSSSLRLVMLSGDRVALGLPERIREAATSELDIIALGGATEAAIWSCYYDTKELAPGAHVIPYGRHLPGQRLYVLSPALRPLPIGVPGDLWIAGAGVARGYLGQPELTSERFMADPYVPGQSMYKTGDRALVLADGNHEFLGRVDDQIKIGGLRIELGEIEAALMQAPGVERGVVSIVEHDGRRMIAAYVLPHAAEAFDTVAVGESLRQALPAYMLPASIMTLESVPLTANGKVDRKRLPLPAFEIGSVKASTAAEAVLVNIWQSLLGLAQVGVQDNFFALGGDSILAIQMASRAAEQDVRITAQDVFRYPTIAQLAVNGGFGAAQGVLAEQGLVDGEVALSPIQKWYVDWPGADWEQFSQGVYFDLHAQVDPQLLSASLAAVARHHDVLGIGWRHDGSTWHQESGAGAAVEVLVEDLRGQADALACLEQSAGALQQSLSLNAASVWAARIYRLDEGWRLVWLVHHVSVDGVSWRILLEDLLRAYGALQRGEAVSLPAKTVSYQAWTQHLATWGNQLPASQLAYWQRMEGSGTDVPMDGDASVSEVGSEARVSLQLDRLMTQQLLREAGERYRVRPEELLVAALARTLCAWSASQECVVDIEGHGRDGVEGVDVGRTVGWFTSLYPLRLTLEGGLANDLKAVKERMRGVPHGGQSYGALRYGREDSGLGRHERSVSFNYLGQWRLDELGTPLAGWRGQAPGGSRRPTMRRRHALEVLAYVQESQLHVDFQYSDLLHRAETMATLAHSFQVELQALLTHCLSVNEGVTALVAQLNNVEAVYGLTPMQEGMLYHALARDGMYVEQLACTLTGILDEQALQDAWNDVVASNPVLRTSFHWEGLARPVQVVHQVAQVPWVLESWAEGLDMDAWLRADRRKGLDLRTAPCLRCALLHTGPQRYEWVVTYSHLLLDGWSLSLMIEALAQAYAAQTAGQPYQPPVRSPFIDYVSWSQATLDQGVGEHFWHSQLYGFEGVRSLSLPVPDVTEAYAEPVLINVQRSLVATLEKQQRVTLATVVAGCWAVLLSRYGEGDDVLFGMTSAGRRAQIEGSESMMGLLIETRPTRIEVDEQAPLGDWLRTIMQEEAKREEAGAVSLAQIESWGGAERGARLFDTLVVVENQPMAMIGDLLGSQVVVANVRTVECTNWPLTVVVLPEQEQLRLVFLYDPEHYARQAIEQVARHFSTLLASAGEAVQVADLQMLDEAEREMLVERWSGADQVHAASNRTIVERIEEQATLRPDAIALRLGERSMSYAELTTRGRRVAAWLQRQDVGVGGRVAIVGERTMETIAAMYGILLSGAAYVPLDPDWPEERKRLVIEDAQPQVFIGSTHMACGSSLQISLETLEGFTDERLTGRSATPQDLAYVIFTSGSTGRPKGVMVRHADVMHLDGLQDAMALSDADVWTSFHSYAFDFSVLEIWYPLMWGATVVPVPYWVSREPEAFLALICAEKVTIICQTPAAFEQLISTARPGCRAGHVRWVLLGGDRYSAALFAAGDPAEFPNIANVYGITETTVITTFEPLERDRPVAIGRPFPGQRIYLLDRKKRLVPPGAVGEMYICGEGVAAGYMGAEALTAQRFSDDPYQPGARMYRSGDLARFLPGGRLESIGRADHQVKIRGYRIELGEVESALSSLAVVNGAIVDVRNGPNGRQLVAWYVAAESVSALDVRAALKSLLPESAIPSALIRVDAFPLTPNGKVDRKALPLEDAVSLPSIRPSSHNEMAIEAIWCEVLGQEAIGVHTNFFDAGGDSIAIVRVHGLMAVLPGAERLRVVDLFQCPTIAAIAEKITSSEAQTAVGDDSSARGVRRRQALERHQNARSKPQ
uniref:Nonribosomal peptide synthetase SpiDE1 n=1 Tax=Pseudomonas sp. Q71576 TaxID=1231908 RepID=V5IZL9_9PSED|nr:nonribosomal peptide synthetase SpiDE1 [Pseudomonas sp. Q71576]